MKRKTTIIKRIVSIICLLSISVSLPITSHATTSYNETNTIDIRDVIAGNVLVDENIVFPYENHNIISFINLSRDVYPRSTVSDGTYYMNNRDEGKFLNYVSSTSTNSVSGRISSLQNKIKWVIVNYDNTYCLIKPAFDTSKCLSGAASTSSSAVSLVSTPSTITNQCLWKITIATGGGCIVANKASNRVLYSSNGVISTQPNNSTDYDKKVWRIAADTYYTTARELSSFRVSNNNTYVGDISTPMLNTVTPSNSMWATISDFVYSSSSTKISIYNTTQTINSKSAGTATITATHKVTGISSSFSINVSPLLIYQTKNRELYGINEEDPTDPDFIPEDMDSRNKSTQELITNNSYISLTDLYTSAFSSQQIPLSERESMLRTFCASQLGNDPTFTPIINSMITHFMGGTGSNYSNQTLTNQVVNHQRTQAYVNGVKGLLNEYIQLNDGNISGLYYDVDLWSNDTLRNNHPMVSMMQSEISSGNTMMNQPVYAYGNGVPGLTLCLDSIHGNKFEIESYSINGNTYSGSIKFTLYDHFGLDTPDLSDRKFDVMAPGVIPAFRQWYIMQHWNELSSSPKPAPYITLIEFSVSFSGYLG